jgi:hypothetical protein
MQAEFKTGLAALALGLGLGAADAALADKLYKWTDADGNVHYTDHAPTPAEAKTQERKRFGDKPTDVSIPYALQRALKKYPVTLYTADCGEGCTKAAALLAKRGVPYTEKNARDPAVADELKAINGGKVEVPFMKVGTSTVRGFEEGAWNESLDAAGYPSSAVIPTNALAKKAPGKPEPADAKSDAKGKGEAGKDPAQKELAQQSDPAARDDNLAADGKAAKPAQ